MKRRTIYVDFSSIDRVKKFVNDIDKINGNFELVSGRYVIDAKSILGILSLDLTKPIQLNIITEDIKILETLKEYEVEEK